MNAEPNSVNTKNFNDAYRRSSSFHPNTGTSRMLLSPQMPIMKYIGSNTTSKNTKNSTRSSATNVPVIPVARMSMNTRRSFGLCGSGQWFHEYTITSTLMSADSTTIGSEMPSTAMWK